MVIYYKTMIRFNPRLKALFYILGGALYKKLVISNYFRKRSKKKDHSKYVKETEEKITEIIKLSTKYYAQGSHLYFNENNFVEANSHFEKALSSCFVPSMFCIKSVALQRIWRYKESVMDSIFVLRNLGPREGLTALLPLLKYKTESGSAIYAIDIIISMEYNFQQMDENKKEALKFMKRKGLFLLKNIFKSHSLVFQKKYKEAIPFLEEAENIISIKSGYTSVILLLLYFIYKKYEKVFSLGDKILENDNTNRDIVIYLFGMSSYYTKKLRIAINYLEKIAPIGIGKLTLIRGVRNFVQKADRFMQNGNLKGLSAFYDHAKELAKDNDQLLAHIWNKLGILNLHDKNFEQTVKCLTYSIDLVGKRKYVLVVRSEAYEQLGLTKEAEDDLEEALKLIENEAESSL